MLGIMVKLSRGGGLDFGMAAPFSNNKKDSRGDPPLDCLSSSLYV
jgi:hypothetical protein